MEKHSDNIGIGIAGDLDSVADDIWELGTFRYIPKKGFVHKLTEAIADFYRYMPGHIELTLSQRMNSGDVKKHKREYPIWGIVRAPIHKSYGVIAPALQDILDYCWGNKLPAAFLPLDKQDPIVYIDPAKGKKVRYTAVESRKPLTRFRGLERRTSRKGPLEMGFVHTPATLRNN